MPCQPVCSKADQLHTHIRCKTGFPGGSVAKNPPAKQETRIRFRGREDPVEEGKATHSSVLAGKIPWTEEPGGLVFGAAKSQTSLSD